MARNLQEEIDPDLEEVYRRSRTEWLNQEDISNILAKREDLPTSTEPIQFLEEGLFLFNIAEHDIMDTLNWDLTEWIEFPVDDHDMRYLDGKLILVSIEDEDGVDKVYEKRCYECEDRYGTYRLAHFRCYQMTSTDDDDSDDDDNSGGDDNIEAVGGAPPHTNGFCAAIGIQTKKEKIPEVFGSQLSSQAEKTLSSNKSVVHFIQKILDGASKQQLTACISSLRRLVAPLLCNMFRSVVVEHAYHLGTAAQKQEVLAELYSTELQLFKCLTSTTEKRVVDIIAKLGLQKSAVNRQMTAIIQPILENEIVDHTIIHKFLNEYLTIADKTSAADVLQLLTSPILLCMVHTRDGSRLAMLSIKHGSAKVLAGNISIVDDTKLVTKIIVRELEPTLKDLVIDKNGRRPLLQLLHPNCSRYFSHDDLASLDLSVPSLCSMTKDEQEDTVAEHTDHEENVKAAGGKKDPIVRRQELLVNSGLAERLIDECVENAEEFLKSNFGKEVLYEVAIGGSDGILYPSLSEKLSELYEAISSVAAKPKPQESEKDSEHILENFHSSRTIRRLVLDCPGFASTLFKKALSGKSRSWASGHCSKILSAFLETEDLQVREMAKTELQVLVNEGTLKISANKKPE